MSLVQRPRAGDSDIRFDSGRALIYAPHPGEVSNIVLTVRLFWGMDGDGETGNFHPSLEDSLAALQETFPGQDFRYADAVVARVRANESFEASGLLAVAGGDNPLPYSLRAGPLAVSGRPDVGPRTIHLDNLRFGATYRVHQVQRTEVRVKEAGVRIDVDAPEGQATVIGKTGLGGGYGALYLVLTAEVLD